WTLDQRVLVDISQRSLRANYLGAEHALPFMLGPTGLAGMLARDGEVQAARAAGKAGIPFGQATPTACAMADVPAATAAARCSRFRAWATTSWRNRISLPRRWTPRFRGATLPGCANAGPAG